MINAVIDPIAKLLGDWANEVNIFSIILRLFLAFIASFLIGIERSTKQHTTGLRTTLLIAIGSCTAMLINLYLGTDGAAKTDLTRLAAGVITGIGMIGGGSIIVNSRKIVTGVTSAAAMFVSSVLGMAFGAGLYVTGIIALGIIMLTLSLLSPIEGAYKKKSFIYSVHIELDDPKVLVDILDFVRKQKMMIKAVNNDSAYIGTTLTVYSIMVVAKDRKNFIHSKDLIKEIAKFEHVHFVETL